MHNLYKNPGSRLRSVQIYVLDTDGYANHVGLRWKHENIHRVNVLYISLKNQMQSYNGLNMITKTVRIIQRKKIKIRM